MLNTINLKTVFHLRFFFGYLCLNNKDTMKDNIPKDIVAKAIKVG